MFEGEFGVFVCDGRILFNEGNKFRLGMLNGRVCQTEFDEMIHQLFHKVRYLFNSYIIFKEIGGILKGLGIIGSINAIHQGIHWHCVLELIHDIFVFKLRKLTFISIMIMIIIIGI